LFEETASEAKDQIHSIRPVHEQPAPSLLETLLESWDRNNTILLNLLRVLERISAK
jgi:hypothetical protein